MSNAIVRNHRTVLFVDGPALKANASYLERVKRLSQSLNGVNIKTDIYTVFPEKVSMGGIVAGISTSPASTDESNYFDAARLNALATSKGYTQCLISSSVKSNW